MKEVQKMPLLSDYVKPLHQLPRVLLVPLGEEITARTVELHRDTGLVHIELPGGEQITTHVSQVVIIQKPNE